MNDITLSFPYEYCKNVNRRKLKNFTNLNSAFDIGEFGIFLVKYWRPLVKFIHQLSLNFEN